MKEKIEKIMSKAVKIESLKQKAQFTEEVIKEAYWHDVFGGTNIFEIVERPINNEAVFPNGKKTLNVVTCRPNISDEILLANLSKAVEQKKQEWIKRGLLEKQRKKVIKISDKKGFEQIIDPEKPETVIPFEKLLEDLIARGDNSKENPLTIEEIEAP